MIIREKYEIGNEAIASNLKKMVNQVYKLLPNREEGLDWGLPLQTIIEELFGMDRLLADYHVQLFAVLCKLEGLFLLEDEEDFFMYRRTIFECLTLLNTIKEDIYNGTNEQN